MSDKLKITINGKERERYYGSRYELNGGVPEGVTSNYISLWAQKMRDHDPDGNKADKIAEKYMVDSIVLHTS